MKKSSYVDYVVNDVFSRLKGVTARAMFGGHGLYLDGKIFAIIADEVLYFKTDESNRAEYETRGSKPFTYEGARGRKVAMSYWEVPATILEDTELVAEWAERSAVISKKPGKQKLKKKK